MLVACGVPDEGPPTACGYVNTQVIGVSITLDHLTLAAHAARLDMSWVAWLKDDSIRETLDVPEDVRVLAMTPFCHLDEAPEDEPRRIHRNR